MDTSTTPFPLALDQAPADIRDRLLSYRPASVPADLYRAWAPHLIALAAAYGPASPTEAKVTLTALCQLLGLVSPRLGEPNLRDLLTETNIGELRARLIAAQTNEGTVNNRIGRLNQLLAVTRGLARTNYKTPRPAEQDPEGRTSAYTVEELAVLHKVAGQAPIVDLVVSAGLAAGLVVPHLANAVWRGRLMTEHDWEHARRLAKEAGVALVATRLRATWREQLLTRAIPLAELRKHHGLTVTDLTHLKPSSTETAAEHWSTMR
jgi:hypothetical protein